MNHFKNDKIIQDFYIRDLFSLEEFILVNGNAGFLDNNIKIKRLCSIYIGGDVFEEIPVENFDKNDESHQTTLNYFEFIDYFDIHNFEQSNSEYFSDKEYGFIEYCCNYIEQFTDNQLKPLLLKDLLTIHNDSIRFLEETKNPSVQKIRKSLRSQEFDTIEPQKPNKVIIEIIDFLLSMYNSVYKSFSKRYADIYPAIFLTNSQEENNIQINPTTEENQNPEPRIFTSFKAFEFFERLLEEFKILEDKDVLKGQKKKHFRDFSFIYRKMVEDEFIYGKETYPMIQFVGWFSEKYNITYEKPKTWVYIEHKDERHKIYREAKRPKQ